MAKKTKGNKTPKPIGFVPSVATLLALVAQNHNIKVHVDKDTATIGLISVDFSKSNNGTKIKRKCL